MVWEDGVQLKSWPFWVFWWFLGQYATGGPHAGQPAQLPTAKGPAQRTHQHDVTRPVLDGAKEPQDDHHDVDECGQDGRPLVAQEVEYLALQGSDLGQGQRVRGSRAMKALLPQHPLEGLLRSWLFQQKSPDKSLAPKPLRWAFLLL